NGSATVPAGYNLASGTTYYWRAKNVDSSAASSSSSTRRYFLVDCSARTMVSATVVADGVTVTVTWSENLDQTQAVPGSAFSIAQIGRASCRETVNIASDAAANQNKYTLIIVVHHLEPLELTYTKPDHDPIVLHTATH